ncbi:MAG: gluconate 2-dehydrogenase subunit 3 family protein [Actinomycetota bacterium]|nr:gluconate 2-dehydrogenase subunit 3 family protein [Actinomycetota bacterium]
MRSLERRQVLKTASLAGLGLLLPPELLRAASSPRDAEDVAGRSRWLVFTAHQAAVVEEATARLIPGPLDDPSERGHPGAREADVTRYIDTMLGALSLSPAKVFAGGPFSNRAGNPSDDMAEFIGLTPGQAYGWKRRIAGWRHQYSVGIASLDRAAGGSFIRATAAERDAVLARNEEGFVSLLFAHAIEGMYSNPEYGGNAGLVGWRDIKFPGDVQPRGYSDAEVSRSDGPDRYEPAGAAAKLLNLIKISNGR